MKWSWKLERANDRRIALIEREFLEGLTPAEAAKLAALNAEVDLWLDHYHGPILVTLRERFNQLKGGRVMCVNRGITPAVPPPFTVRCPDWPQAGITENQILGCGSLNIEGPDFEGLYDCCDCGLWFRPEEPPAGWER